MSYYNSIAIPVILQRRRAQPNRVMASCQFPLPIIDLNLLKGGGSSDIEEQEVKKVREACSELGFFRVINHGIDPNVTQTMDSVARDMLALPTDIKEGDIFPSYSTNYCPSKIGPLGKDDSMPESMTFHSPRIVEEIYSKLCPQGKDKSRETIPEYMSGMSELSNGMLKLIMYSLGENVGKQYGSSVFDEKLRFNFYPKVAEASVDEENLYKGHTDVGCLTIIYEDDVGGLQIRTKEGQWVDSKPLPGSFVVIIGDSIQMWSNGRYRSSEHRVIHGGPKRSRLSIAFYLLFSDEVEILAPGELISEEYPQLYKAVTTKDLKSLRKEVGLGLGALLAHLRL